MALASSQTRAAASVARESKKASPTSYAMYTRSSSCRRSRHAAADLEAGSGKAPAKLWPPHSRWRGSGPADGPNERGEEEAEEREVVQPAR